MVGSDGQTGEGLRCGWHAGGGPTTRAPHRAHLPPAHRRFEQVCATGYGGRKRGEVVRTRTTVLHGATSHWLATFSGVGNGDLTAELVRALQAIITYAQLRCFPSRRPSCASMGSTVRGPTSPAFRRPGWRFSCAAKTMASCYRRPSRPVWQSRPMPRSPLPRAEPRVGSTIVPPCAFPAGPICRVINCPAIRHDHHACDWGQP